MLGVDLTTCSMHSIVPFNLKVADDGLSFLYNSFGFYEFYAAFGVRLGPTTSST